MHVRLPDTKIYNTMCPLTVYVTLPRLTLAKYLPSPPKGGATRRREDHLHEYTLNTWEHLPSPPQEAPPSEGNAHAASATEYMGAPSFPSSTSSALGGEDACHRGRLNAPAT